MNDIDFTQAVWINPPTQFSIQTDTVTLTTEPRHRFLATQLLRISQQQCTRFTVDLARQPEFHDQNRVQIQEAIRPVRHYYVSRSGQLVQGVCGIRAYGFVAVRQCGDQSWLFRLGNHRYRVDRYAVVSAEPARSGFSDRVFDRW